MVDVSSLIQPLEQLVLSHPTWAAMAAMVWPVSGMILNVLLYIHPLPIWEAELESHPRYAAFAKFVRAVGIDPVQIMQAFVNFVFARAGSVKK